MKKLLISLIILSLIIPLSAQLTFTNYSNQNAIEALAEDGNYIWIGTTGGLLKRNKSTGALVAKYMMSDGMVSNDIAALAIDQQGNKWICTSSGVSKFDGSTFTNYQNGDGLLGNDVRGIAIDVSGNIWFGTTIGVSMFNGDHWKTFPTTHGVMDIATDESGTLWAATWSGGAVKISDSEMTYYTTSNSDIPGNILMCVETDNSGNVWFGFYNADAVAKFDGTIWTEYNGMGTYVYDIKVDVLGNKWIARLPGIRKYDDATWTNYSTPDLIYHIVHAIEFDDQGNKWFGTLNGLSRFDDTDWTGFKISAGLTNNDVMSLKIHDDGSTWFGTMDGVFVLDGTTWTHHDDVDLSNNEILSICTDDPSTVWAGTTTGLAKYESGTWTGYTTADGFPSNYISCINIDKNGIIWFGSPSGVTIWDGGAGAKTTLLAGENVYDIFTASDGTVWVATNGNGLYRFIQNNYSSPNNHYTSSNSDLHTDYCRRLVQDSSGDIWIGGNSHVSIFDGSDFTYIYLGSYGFTTSSITGIDIDNLGNIWLSGSYHGILKHNGTNWVRYDANDGLAHNYTNAITVDQDQNIWVGTIGGASKISCQAPEVNFEADIPCWPASTQFDNLSSPTDATTRYEWDIGNNGSVDYTTEDFTHQFPSHGAYEVKLTAINDHCQASYTTDVQVYSMPQASVDPQGSTTICDGTPLILVADIANYYGSLQYTYLWNTGETTSSISASEAGTYSVTISHKDCSDISSGENVTVTYPYNDAEICMVSVDDETDKNMIMWDRTPGEGIVAYNIYKLFGSNFIPVGQVPYDDLSVFVDHSSSPQAVAARYAISITDGCGNESDLSPYHQTIHLGASEGLVPNTVELDWTEYMDEGEVFTYSYFYIYRGSSASSLELLDSVSNSITAFTDLDAQGNIYYRIGVKSPALCTPSGNLKADSGPYSHSMSNLEDNRLQTAANEPPSDITMDDQSIDEEVPVSSLVGRFSTSDPNAEDQHTYTLVSGTGDTDNGSFIIVSDLLLSAEEFDYETKSSYSIRIKTTDNGTDNMYYEESFTITINNISETGTNLAPTNITIDDNSIDENTIAGTMVGRFSSIDPNPGDSHTYTLVSGTGSTNNSSFAIAGNLLISAEIFDYETKNSYSILVRSTDDGTGNLNYEKVFTINITDVTETPANQDPTNIALDINSIAENSNSGTLIGRFTTTDPDVSDYHTYTLVSGTGDTDNSSFIIAGDAILSGVVFDFETKSSYSILVRTTDNGNGNLYYEEQFTITISDVSEADPNNAPTDLSIDNNSIDENAMPGTYVGRLSTTDPDSGDGHTYSLVTGTGDADNASFTIVGDLLLSAEKFDYETKTPYAVRIRTTDDGEGNLNLEEFFVITINDVTEAGPNAVPDGISLDNMFIDENENAGSLIGRFTTSDDDTGDTHTYSFVSGTGSDDNNSFIVAGDVLLASEVFDFETKSSYSIRVRTTDNGTDNLFYEDIFTITISDVMESAPNSAPTDILLDVTSIDENANQGTFISRFTTTDVDTLDMHSYALVSGIGSDDNSSFVIVGDILISGEKFDYETKNSYSIRVRTTDNGVGNLTIEETFTITINNLSETGTNHAPISIALDNATINENENAGSLIGKFTTTDDDVQDIHTYSLVSGIGDDDNNDFVVAGNLLLSGTKFDFESKDTFYIRIRSTDNGTGNLYFESTFTVAILNVLEPDPNEAPSDISVDNLTIDENKTAGSLLGRMSSVDPNASDQHTYRLVAGDGDTDNNSFTILGDLLLSAVSLDFETKDELSIRIQTTDNGEGSMSFQEVFTITVIDQIDVRVMDREDEKFLIYPNPFRDMAILEFPNPEEEEFRLTVMDLTGKVVRLAENITTGRYELMREDLPAGYYFIELRGSRVFRGRVIIE